MQSFDLFLNQLNKNISVIIAYVVIRKLFDHREDLHLFAAHDLRNQIVQLLTVSEAERSGFDIVGSDVAISLVAELARGVFPALAWWGATSERKVHDRDIRSTCIKKSLTSEILTRISPQIVSALTIS